ncbi:MAG: ATP synthase F1 subunit delta [Magnetococcus sp. DMHC-6]
MHESTLAKRYAAALADLAAQETKLEVVGQDLSHFLQLFQSTPSLRLLLTSPTSSQKEQMEAVALFVEKAGPPVVQELTGKFLKLLVAKRRISLIESIQSAYNREIETRSGQMTVHVQTAKPFLQAQKDKLVETLSALTGRTIHLAIQEEPALLGGMVIWMGSQMMDYSVKSRLNRLHAFLKG